MATVNSAVRISAACLCLGLLFAAASSAHGQAGVAAPAEGRVFTVARGGFSLEAPEGWQRVQPKSGIVETEFSIPSEGKGADGAALPAGRMTVMGKDPVGDEKGIVIAQHDLLDESGRLVFSCLTRALLTRR